MVRAIMEGVAFSLRDALDVMLPLARCEEYLVTGGGTASELWLQTVADVLQAPLLKPVQNQGAAYGAALLAFQGVGQGEALALAQQSISEVIKPGDVTAYTQPLERYHGE
jgi:xylulokinase